MSAKNQEVSIPKDFLREEETKIDHREILTDEVHVLDNESIQKNYHNEIKYTEEGQKVMEEEMTMSDHRYMKGMGSKNDSNLNKGSYLIGKGDAVNNMITEEEVQGGVNVTGGKNASSGHDSDKRFMIKEDIKREVISTLNEDEISNSKHDEYTFQSNPDSKDPQDKNDELVSFNGLENLEDILDSSMNATDRYIIERSPDNDGQFIRYNVRVDSNFCKDVWKAYDTMRGIEVAWNAFDVKGLPIEEVTKLIEKINKLFDQGKTIIYWTARGSRTGINWFQVTLKQLNDWGCKFTELKLGKPNYDLFIDDKNINSEEFFK